MAYQDFDPTKPDPATQGITAFGQSTRDNDKAVRDAVVSGAAKGWNFGLTAGAFNATWSGTTLTVSGMTSGQIAVGMTVYVSGVAKGVVVAQTGGTQFGSAGATFTMDTTQTYATSTAMTAANTSTSLPASDQYTKGSEKLLAVYEWGTAKCLSEEWWYYNGSTWDRIGKETYTYTGNDLTSSLWS